MGQALVDCANADAAFALAAATDIGDDLAAALPSCDAVIDFTHATSTIAIAEACAAVGKILVIGTTGHHDDDRVRIKELSKTIPIVFAPNFSVGVNTLFWLTRKAAEILGPDFDLEVVEMHHRLKKDSTERHSAPPRRDSRRCPPTRIFQRCHARPRRHGGRAD
jgi:4-hydroxy-tetrahydrodipicolinate reductase